MKKYCWIILLFASQISWSQPGVNKKGVGKEIKKDGQCFTKIPVHIYETHEETYPVFTGEKKPKGVKLKRKGIILREPITQWVKKKADKNCLSADPNDCTVWCLIESVPGETAYFQYVKNTSKTNEYEMQTFTIYTKVETEYEEFQTVCESDLDNALLEEIQLQLEKLEYLEIPIVRVNMLYKTKRALAEYQRDNNIPAGYFDYQTLEKLGISKKLY